MVQRKWAFILVVLLLLVGVGVTSMNTAAYRADPPRIDVPQATTTPAASKCLVGTTKSVAPATILLGDTADVSLVVTNTCPAENLPIDMVLLVDESYSMTRGGGGSIEPGATKTVDPGPSAPPPTPTSGSGQVGPGNNQPPFCGGGQRPTPEPTATPTRRWPPPPPTPRIQTPVPTAVLEYPGSDDQIREVKSWVRDFLGEQVIDEDMTSGRLKIGFVSFSRKPRVRQALSSDPNDVRTSVGRIQGDDITRIQDGVREALRTLDGQGARTENGDNGRIKIVIILSDFQFCDSDVSALPGDVVVMSVGFGVRNYDQSKLARMASGRSYVFDGGKAAEVTKAYSDDFARLGKPVSLAGLTARDELTADMSLEAGSWQPPTATVAGQVIEWPVLAPPSPVTFTYKVRPLVEGTDLLVSTAADASYTDTLGLTGVVPFPEVRLNVIRQTPTPSNTPTATNTATATPTDTATPTPTPGDLYLPVARKNWPPPIPTNTPPPTPTVCIPELQTIDVALVVDTSTSMSSPTHAGGQAKLSAAIAAGGALVDILKPQDQAAVLGFNATATLVLGLTNDRAAIQGAMAQLPGTQAVGTNIYDALEAAYAELIGPRHVSDHNRSIVLVTDGQHNSTEHSVDDVRALAQEIRAAGIEIVTVGLGTDIDAPLLQDVSSGTGYYFAAPDAAELMNIYREIAHLIPCP